MTIRKILIVDDSATILMSVKGSLELQSFSVETTQDGLLVVEKLEKVKS